MAPGPRKTREVQVDLYLLWPPQKIERQYRDPQKRIFDSLGLGSAIDWFFML